jgi:RNA polymerase sigma-70 factor (ECF subfamily)
MNKPKPQESFETTHWSIIRAAADHDVSDCREAMQELCQRYWFPLYAFARRGGCDSNQSEDMIQAFFLRMLEKDVLSKADRERGRFRNFLLASLKNFMANESAKAAAPRRAGQFQLLSLDFRDAEGRLAYEAVDNLSPDAHYHRQWALEVLQRTVEKLKSEFASEGKSDLFDALQPYLSAGSERLPYSAVAEKLSMTSEAIKVAVHRMRRRYRRRLEAEIVDTVSSPAEVEQEIQDLFRALGAANGEM